MKGLQFNAERHFYTLDGEYVPGVTTVLGVLDKPALPKWAARTVAEYVADNMYEVRNLAGKGRNNVINRLREVPWEKRDDAADRGTTLHELAEAHLKGKPIKLLFDDPMFPVMQHLERFTADWQIEPLLIEAPVASREHGYAGTGDLVCRFVNPHSGAHGTAVADWKFGQWFYPEYAMQKAAYAFAEFTGLDGDERPLPLVTDALGLHVTPAGVKVYPVEFGEHVFREFVTILETFHIKKRMDGDWRVPGTGYVKQPFAGRK